MAVVAVPLVVIAFMAMRRRTAAGEVLADDEAPVEARTDQEFAEAQSLRGEMARGGQGTVPPGASCPEIRASAGLGAWRGGRAFVAHVTA